MTMMASEIRICYRLYLPWQEELRTAWLERMAREGWHLTSVCGVRYEFIKGNPHRLAMPVECRGRGRSRSGFVRCRTQGTMPAA